MTTQNHETIDVGQEDELIVLKLLSQMVQDDRWDLTERGREYMQTVNGNHHHRLVLWPFGKKSEPHDCVDPKHMRSDGNAVWRCECGYRICRGCFEVHPRHYTISVVDQR